MSGKMVKIAAIVALLVAQACAGQAPEAKNPVTARLADRGVSPSSVSLNSYGQVAFINGDTKRHQIYSSDCAELSSTILEPGQEIVAKVGTGPKVCHYQDLLAPSAAQYWGTVEVTTPPSGAGSVWFNPGASGR